PVELCLVESFVCRVNQRVALRAMFGESRHADTHGDGARDSREDVRKERAAEFFGHGRGTLKIRGRKNDSEFFASESANQIHLAQLMRKDGGSVFENFVAQQM